MLMNVFNFLNLLLTSIFYLDLGESQGLLTFFSWICTFISVEFFMIQIIYRGRMLPFNHRFMNIIQLAIFIVTSCLYFTMVICWIPTSMDYTFVECGQNFNIIFTVGGFLMLLLDVLNSLYVIFLVTYQQIYSKEKDYLEFIRLRLPVLCINISLCLMVLIFILTGSSNNYDVADIIFSFILFISLYYFVDFKEFVLAHRPGSSSNRNPPSPGNSPTSPEKAVFEPTGEITIVTD
jgi:hypothetical protein